jgi:hypothetical protein
MTIQGARSAGIEMSRAPHFRSRLGMSALLLLLAAAPARAQFEGVLEMKLSTGLQDGERHETLMKLFVSKAGIRHETSLPAAVTGGKMVMLFRNDTPDKMYMIFDAKKTYSVIDLGALKETAENIQSETPVTVKKLGQEKILGYDTQHVQINYEGSQTELWTSKELLDFSAYHKLEQRRGGRSSGGAYLKALRESGADGFPLRSVFAGEGGSKAVMEVVKINKQALPAALFEIPKDYTLSKGGMLGAVMSESQAAEAKAAMEKAMEQMTPEQREQMQKMLK